MQEAVSNGGINETKKKIIQKCLGYLVSTTHSFQSFSCKTGIEEN